jgi:transaldolase/glucose-6-phosphate isomerase
MPANRLRELRKYGQSVWQDYIQRSQILSGDLARLIDADGISGQTSNPTYFDKAISESDEYEQAIKALVGEGKDASEIYESLAVEDIQMATDLYRAVYDSDPGADGFVSLEVSPNLAGDTEATIAEARRLFAAVNRPNVMIKVPGTPEGIPAIEQLTSEGININVTLLFSLEAYEQAARAYIAGLERYAEANRGDLSRIGSVASFFLSRVDVLVDKKLQVLIEESEDPATRKEIEALLGQAAVGQAKLAYVRFKAIFGEPRFQALREKGARVQRPLWASTGTKNPAYSDVMYVEPLIGPDTVNTIPPATLDAFRHHGKVSATLEEGVEEAQRKLAALEEFGIDMDAVTQELLDDGVRIFARSYNDLLDGIAAQRAALLTANSERAAASLGSYQAGVERELRRLEEERFAERLRERDPSIWSDDAATRDTIQNRLGWLTVAGDMTARVDELTAFAGEIREAGCRHAVLLGMGGSSLAAEVLSQTFGAAEGCPELIVLDTTDPTAIQSVDAAIDPAKTLFIVASKSGTTIEVLSLFAHFWERVKGSGVASPGEAFIAVTDDGTPLEKLADEHGFRRVFTNPSDVGGRYSALSCFGLVPSALTGVDVAELLQRATAAGVLDRGLWLGAVIGVLASEGRDKLTIVAPPEIEAFGAWAEQLIAESTGKDGKGVLPIDREPLAEPSAYGDDRLFVQVALEGDATHDSAIETLRAAGHPVVTLRLGDRFDLGLEFLRWEVATATVGAVLGLNPFDEPNVAESKAITKRLLDEYTETNALPEGEPAAQEGGVSLFADTGASSLRPALAEALKASGAHDYVALLSYLPRSEATERELETIRARLREVTKAAVTLADGPRYLHSTGQLHKGGVGNGLHVIFTADETCDLPIPGRPFTFGVLKRAQALGDFAALRESGRRAVRVHISGDLTAGLEAITAALSHVSVPAAAD